MQNINITITKINDNIFLPTSGLHTAWYQAPTGQNDLTLSFKAAVNNCNSVLKLMAAKTCLKYFDDE